MRITHVWHSNADGDDASTRDDATLECVIKSTAQGLRGQLAVTDEIVDRTLRIADTASCDKRLLARCMVDGTLSGEDLRALNEQLGKGGRVLYKAQFLRGLLCRGECRRLQNFLNIVKSVYTLLDTTATYMFMTVYRAENGARARWANIPNDILEAVQIAASSQTAASSSSQTPKPAVLTHAAG